MNSDALLECFNERVGKDLNTFIDFHVKNDGSTDATLLRSMREKLAKATIILDNEQEKVDRRLQEEANRDHAKAIRAEQHRREGVLHHIAESLKRAAPANASRDERTKKRYQNNINNYIPI